MLDLKPISALLKADAIIFYSDYGSKAIEESWIKRLHRAGWDDHGQHFSNAETKYQYLTRNPG